MHGEHKTPGGKLVVVDFEVTDGLLDTVELSGDFFLYPEEALEPIRRAINGLSATLDQNQMSVVIQAAIPTGTELLGTSAEAIAIAIARGLAQRDDTP